MARQKARREIVRLPRRLLTNREFAEQYIRLPKTSPFGNVPFRCDRQPYTSLLFDEMDSGVWKTFLVSGPSQSGKTLSAFVIPTLRDVVELRLNTIIGFPEADMASDKWDTDFKPTFEASPQLIDLLPDKGPGSRGGRIRDRITLTNGVDLKIMTCHGDDTAKSGYTSPRVRLTEAAGWSHSGEASMEANPLRQLKSRMKAFKRDDPRRCLFVEGTLTIEEELPWSARGSDDDELLISTRSQILSPCPHCGGWMLPERCNLFGWQQADSEDQAANEAVFLCPLCEQLIDNEQRRASVAECRLVHYGQEVNEHGEVVGPKPPTSTLWFHWKAWHNLLRDAADFGVAEWEAQQIEEGTEERESAEKELCQFDFSVPFKSTLADHDPLKPTEIRKRTDQWKRNVLPHDTVKVTVGVDLGDWTGWWFLVAHRAGGQKHVAAYGAFDVKRNKSDDLDSRIVASLHDLADTIIEPGFPQEGSDGFHLPDVVWIDCGYRPDAVGQFIRERGGIRQKRYWAARGRGASTRNGGYNHPKRVTNQKPRLGKQWFAEVNHKRRIMEVTFNADHWKLDVDARFRAQPGKKGAMTLFAADFKKEHAKLSHHIANEQFKREWEPGKGLVDHWVKTGDNHWKDAAAMAEGAGDMAGVDLLAIEEEPEAEPSDNFYARAQAS